jgi:hypothetical protein
MARLVSAEGLAIVRRVYARQTFGMGHGASTSPRAIELEQRPMREDHDGHP